MSPVYQKQNVFCPLCHGVLDIVEIEVSCNKMVSGVVLNSIIKCCQLIQQNTAVILHSIIDLPVLHFKNNFAMLTHR